MSDDKNKPTVEDAENGILDYVKSHGPTPINDLHYLAIFPPDAGLNWGEEDRLISQALGNLFEGGQLVSANLGDKRGLQWSGKERGDK